MEVKVDANLKEKKRRHKNQPSQGRSKSRKNESQDGHHEKLMMIMKAGKENMEAMREACLEKIGACHESKETTPLEVGSVAVHVDVSKEEATVESFGALKKWHMDRHLARRHHEELKRRTQCDGGSWKKLAATCGGMTHCPIPSPCKGQSSVTRQGQYCKRSP
jgi:hypothetical protein